MGKMKGSKVLAKGTPTFQNAPTSLQKTLLSEEQVELFKGNRKYRRMMEKFNKKR